MTTPVLEIRGLSKSFGALQVARGIGLSVMEEHRHVVLRSAKQELELTATRDTHLHERPFVCTRSRISPFVSEGPHAFSLSSTGKCPYGDWPCVIRSAPTTPE